MPSPTDRADRAIDEIGATVDPIAAQNTELIRRYNILVRFHEAALQHRSCLGGLGNEPCTLNNESDDQNEVCMYHLAVAAQEELKGAHD